MILQNLALQTADVKSIISFERFWTYITSQEL